MIVYPVRRSITPYMRFVAVLLTLYAATLLIFWLAARPTTIDLGIMATVAAVAIAVVGAVGFIAYRMRLIYRLPRVGGVVIVAFLLAALLSLITVWIGAQLLFIEPYDVTVAVALMVLAAGIVMTIGYLQSSVLSEKIDALHSAAEQLALGRYHARVELEDGDELAQLASMFNAVAAKLDAAARKEHQLERMRRDLTAWIAYDLRVPLLSARTMVESIAEGLVTDPEMLNRYLRIARRDINVLSDLIDDLCDMAQVDVTGIRLERTPAHIDKLIELTVEELAQTAAQKDVQLTGRCEPNIPPVSIDVRQISRVLNNLVGDAIQRVPKGGAVKLNAYPGRNGALVEITDSYEGERSEDVKTTFELFFDEDDVRSQTQETPRLRLALADVVVRAHGSRIRPQRLGDQGLRLVFALTKDGAGANPLKRGM
ncbi:MAG: histidine kinase dimerization/phospho-acceptor domain-containing protein [Caldilinea sp.]